MSFDKDKKDLFVLDSTESKQYNSLDDCIDESYSLQLYCIALLVWGHQKKKVQVKNLKPVAFVHFNTKLGKPKPATLFALLDSGTAGPWYLQIA
jgi:hypothetical protein